MLSTKSIFILIVLLVNTIYCENEKDIKQVTKPTADIVVNDVTEVVDEPTTLAEPATTTESGNVTDAPTTIPPLTTTTSNATTVSPNITTVAPNITTTDAPPNTTTVNPITTTPMPDPTPTPSHKDRHFDGASFIGGIILAVGLMGIAFIAFKYYKARTERNYHTL